MAHPRTFRFGVQATGVADRAEWVALARRAEALGYSTLCLPDHFNRQLAPVPAMMAAADATTTLRVGALVLDNDYRHPVVLAKEIATIDVLSGGRVEVGLGAGWKDADYELSGILKDPVGVRIERLAESVQVLRALWTDGPAHHAGDHYHLGGLDGLPKPVQRPHPPILIGGGGRRMLSLAARLADIVGVNVSLPAGAVGAEVGIDALAERVDDKVAWVRDGAGERYPDLELSMRVFVAALTDDRRALADMFAEGFGVSPRQALDVPFAWLGTIEEICQQVQRCRQRWDLSYFVVGQDAMEAMAPVVSRLSGE